MDGQMLLSPDFKEFIALLNKHKVRYLILGGYAVGFHGYPRYTKDLDVWVDCTASNTERLMVALADFGFGDVGLTATDFQEEGQIIQLGYPPNRIDILTSAKGVVFDTCEATKAESVIDGVEVSFVGLDALRKIKREAGRPQDLADLANLE